MHSQTVFYMDVHSNSNDNFCVAVSLIIFFCSDINSVFKNKMGANNVQKFNTSSKLVPTQKKLRTKQSEKK